MAMFKIPTRKVRGVTGPIPSGYVVGRISPKDGDAELIPIAALSANQVASGLVKTGLGSSARVEVGFFLDGPFASSQQFAGALTSDKVTFPNSLGLTDLATLEVGSFTPFTCYLVNDLPTFLLSGPPNGTLAHIDFAARATTGTVTYYNTSKTVDAFTQFWLVMQPTAIFEGSGLTLLFLGTVGV